MPAGIYRLAALFCLMLVTAAMAPQAHAEGLFTVRGVAVEARADSTDAAKRQALADARRQALETLIAKMTRRADRGAVSYPDDAAVDAMISSIQVSDEQTAPDGYRGTFSFDFEPEAVRSLLTLQNIPFTEARAGPALVLPVLQTAGEAALWSDPNPWLDAWERFDSSSRLTPIRTPFGDVEDVLAIAAEDALAGDEQAISAMAERYGVETVFVVEARLAIDQEAGQRDMDVSMSSYGPDSFPVVTRGFSGSTDEEMADFLDGAVTEMVGEIEELWKALAIASAGQQESLSALVPLGGLGEWVDIRRRIEGIHLVQRLELEVLNVNGALIAIHHAGDADRFLRAARSSGLEMEERPEGYWIVTRRGAGR